MALICRQMNSICLPNALHWSAAEDLPDLLVNLLMGCCRGEQMYFDDIKLGMTAEIAPAVIEKEKMLAFARDYDNIPLHTDEEYAKKTPFGKLIAPGVMSLCRCGQSTLKRIFSVKNCLRENRRRSNG